MVRSGMILGLVASSVLLAGASFAAGGMEAAYGNTLQVTASDGTVTSYHINEDGTYSATSGDTTVSGTWALKGDQSCVTPEGGEEQCGEPVGDHAVGDSWEVTGSDGTTASLTLIEGQ